MEFTNDSLFDGNLQCRQHGKGYRFSVDAVLAAHFCQPKKQARILDLGCGSGIIGLILCYRHLQITVTGLELQPALARLARENAELNEFVSKLAVTQGDLRTIKDYFQPESFELVVSNPPYRPVGSGRLNREDECALARHELTADIHAVVRAAAYAVKNRGTVVCIYPAARLAELLNKMENHRLVPKRLQPVYSYPQAENATLVLVEAVKNGGQGVELLAPFYIYQFPDGPYTDEMARLYR